jgi:uncharacterized protein with FMN-binding domain
MKNARKIAFAASLTAIAVLVACSDRRPDKGSPTAPMLFPGARAGVMGTCTTLANLQALAGQVFGSGSPNVNSVLGKLGNLDKAVQSGDTAQAHAQANNIVDFVKTKAGDGRLPGTPAQIHAFLGGVMCYAGLAPDIFLIQPSDQSQIIKSDIGTSGVRLPPNPVGVPTLLTITTLPSTGPSPLITKLDQYPTYIDIKVSSPLVGKADVAVCPVGVIPSTVLHRLRLGHQRTTAGFEVAAKADSAPFLTCTISTASSSRLPGWLRTVASLVMPKPLYAQFDADRGGVGGSVTEFSPFDAVDPELTLDRGGVGGSVTEFKKTGTTRPAISPAPSTSKTGSATTGITGVTPAGTTASVSDPCGTTVNTEVSSSCRPSIIIRTRRDGTVMSNVQVNWSVESGGGRIAPVNNPCGTIDQQSLSTTTDAAGSTGVCWKVGPTGGTNTVKATPVAGTPNSDAPAGVYFFDDTTKHSLVFAIEAQKLDQTISFTAPAKTFGDAPFALTATATSGLPVTFASSTLSTCTVDGSTATIVAAGPCTIVASQVGNGTYNAAPDVSQNITIAKATATLTLGNLGPFTYDGTPKTATVTTIPAGLTGVTVSGSGTNAASYAANASLSNPNYDAAPVSGNLVINKATATCSVSGYTGVYDAGAHGASGSCTGVAADPSAAGSTLSLGSSFTNVPGGTANWTFTGGTNYLDQSGSVGIVLSKAPATVALSNMTQTYTGSPLTPTATTTPGSLMVVWTNAPQTNAGAYPVTATVSDGNYDGSASGTFTITKATATLSLGNLGPFTYNGTERSATASTIPAGLSGVTVTGSGTNVGSYPASASLNNANYDAPPVTGTLVINRAIATLTLGNLGAFTYDGTPKAATVTTDPAGLTGVTVNGSGTNAGTYAASASLSNPNYDAIPVTGNLVINKATATCSISGYSGQYDAAAHGASGSCTGVAADPSAAGSSLNLGTSFTNVPGGTAAWTFTGGTNYLDQGGSVGIVLSKAPATVVLSNMTQTYTGSPLTPTATTTPGSLTVLWTNAPQTNAGTYTVTATVSDANYDGSATGTFTITKATATLSLGNLGPYTYDGTQKSATASAIPAGLSGIAVTGSGTNVGSYPASASLSNANYNAAPASGNIVITQATSATVVSCPAGSYPYTGSAQTPCSASVTGAGGLNLTLLTPTYANNTAAGTATASFTYAGDANHSGSSGSGTFIIDRLASTTTVSCPTIVTYTGSAQTPCNANVTSLGLNAAVTPVSYTSNVVGTATASATYPGGINWNASTGSSTFKIQYVQSGCFASPVYSAMPDSKSAQRKGSNLPIKCTLTTASGAAVTTATGDIQIIDAGTTPSNPPVRTGNVVLTLTNVFKYSNSGNYAYGLDTSPAVFIAGHYYYVVAQWNDRSTTEGWFLLK